MELVMTFPYVIQSLCLVMLVTCSPISSSLFCHAKNIFQGAKLLYQSLFNVLQPNIVFFLLGANILLNTLISNRPTHILFFSLM
jgi:hypothetical protein